MPKRFRFPRNEASRRDRIAQHEIVSSALRPHQTRNDTLAVTPFADPGVTVALSGTATTEGGMLESEAVAGGRTIILTLTGGKWHADVGGNNFRTTALINSLVSDQEEAAGWAAQILAGDGSLDHEDVSRDSDTVVTITLPASASFSITITETITISVDDLALEESAFGKGFEINSVSFKVSAASVSIGGTAVSGGVLESEIVAGGETVIYTLSADTWVTELGDDNATTTAFLAGITGDDGGGNGWDDEVTLNHTHLSRDSDTVLTLTLPAAASYAIAADEDVTTAFEKEYLNDGVKIGSRTFTITNEE